MGRGNVGAGAHQGGVMKDMKTKYKSLSRLFPDIYTPRRA